MPKEYPDNPNSPPQIKILADFLDCTEFLEDNLQKILEEYNNFPGEILYNIYQEFDQEIRELENIEFHQVIKNSNQCQFDLENLQSTSKFEATKQVQSLCKFSFKHQYFTKNRSKLTTSDATPLTKQISVSDPDFNLIDYNFYKHHENFLNSRHECLFCYEVFKGLELVQCTNTKSTPHPFCKECLVRFWRSGMEDFNSWNLDSNSSLPFCPFCSSSGDEKILMITMEQLQNPNIFIDRKILEKFEKILLSKALGDYEIVTCPKITCLKNIYLEKTEATNTDLDLQCPHCEHYFCRSCSRSAHHPIKCSELASHHQILLQYRAFVEKEAEEQLKKSKENVKNYHSMSWLNILIGQLADLDEDDFIENSVAKTVSIPETMIGMTKRQLYDNLRAAYGKKYFNSEFIVKDQERLTLSTINETCRCCPFCFAPIEKSMGCNHMFCTNCKRTFNYMDPSNPKAMFLKDRTDEEKEAVKNLKVDDDGFNY